jgi:probable HAF family extracellular repeat protein
MAVKGDGVVRRWQLRADVLAVVVANVAVVTGVSGATSPASVQSRWVITDLGTLGGKNSEAFLINGHGQIAGLSESATGPTRAFAWQGGRIVKLGGGVRSSARAINERGQVVGYIDTGGGDMRAFLWQNGRAHDLGALRGACPSSLAAATNGRGQVVGWSGEKGNCSLTISLVERAVLWEQGKMTTLGGGPWGSEAVAINERGRIVGHSSITSDTSHAAVWEKGKKTDLGALGGRNASSEAVAINERGQIVGFSYTRSGQRHAVLWQNGRIRDLGTLGGKDSSIQAVSRWGYITFPMYYPDAINTRGQIVGASATGAGDQHAFMWQNGKMRDLGTLGGKDSSALAINDQGQIVGQSTLPSGIQHAFVWQNGRMTDLGTLGGTTSFAGAINERGQIVGSATLKDGAQHAVLWTVRG